ncbi:MAG: quinolinate synthase NadA [Pseudomonadales bacterium]|jgi:quinolinate synthase|nr:quinolinate synthase NadA [Pseudomonadales bacterium]MDP6471019.1 quinolinate synthase NadA [Pseudomonadales bacterium]MDP6825795.1 quinolinate synthase NadA [Pseudomonadales bacterium]MDP6970211.1 quinolinate synthase NadA [Pseudomonadales bacterium]|tara:strand:- start:1379 stop:2422 length:1044 start_codon:yes stop_codon:yes gene_type:complete
MNLPDYSLGADEVPLHEACPIDDGTREALKEEIRMLLRVRDAVLIAHYYVDGDLQDLADETGGFVSDSLEMARFGRDHDAPNIIVAGVRFMGETARILSPEKRVFMPTLESECSLDIGCPPDVFKAFCEEHPERTVVVYANTSVEVKALSDWVVTSSCALEIVEMLDARGEKILWAPDKHLGKYIHTQTGADMVLWSGACVVHEEFKAKGLRGLKALHPEAGVLVHPESPAAVIDIADAVGSTSAILKAARELPHEIFIVGTDRGLFHKLRQQNPGKRFIEAPTAGDGATCRSCAHCPWMAMNELGVLAETLRDEKRLKANEILVDPEVGRRAMLPLTRMLDFQAAR